LESILLNIGTSRTALGQARGELADLIDQFRFGQFLVLRHWQSLKEYANRRGVRLLVDLPIFVSPDSADAWANRELFLLDEELKPRVVADVPPDCFSADGQLWGNPIYNWHAPSSAAILRSEQRGLYRHARQRYDALPEQARGHLWKCLERSPGEPHEAVWELIRLRAYYLWEQAGRPHGREREFWLQADEQTRRSGESTPCQDKI
jgi:hypothetical protein